MTWKLRLQLGRKVGSSLISIGRRFFRHGKLEGRLFFCTPLALKEMILAQDIVYVVPSNTSATCGVKKVATDMFMVAEAHDCCAEPCSYARTDLGSLLAGGGGGETKSPFGALPKPDALVACTGQDHIIAKWAEALKRIYDVRCI